MSIKDYYLKLKIGGEEIKGESTDSKHKDWIEISSFSHGMHQPSAGSSSAGGAKPEGRAQHGEFFITKPLDVASPKLYLALSQGKMVDEAVIELCRATGENVCFMKYTLKNGFISSVSTASVEDSDIPAEVVGVKYTEVEWEYKQLNPDDFKEKTTVSHKYNNKDNTGS